MSRNIGYIDGEKVEIPKHVISSNRNGLYAGSFKGRDFFRQYTEFGTQYASARLLHLNLWDGVQDQLTFWAVFFNPDTTAITIPKEIAEMLKEENFSKFMSEFGNFSLSRSKLEGKEGRELQYQMLKRELEPVHSSGLVRIIVNPDKETKGKIGRPLFALNDQITRALGIKPHSDDFATLPN